MPNPYDNIKHIVVVMLENRSFDNLAGYFYADRGNMPDRVIPTGSSALYNGLADLPPDPSVNPFWNPDNAAFYNDGVFNRVFATKRALDFTIPNPDPEEHFDHMSYQIFGPQPAEVSTPNQMKGFYIDYAKQPPTPEHIMQCYAANQVPVMAALARNYAISDEWFASSPTQTWPNRAFVHLGTSLGKVNNWPYDPYHYDVDTIYNTLDACGHSWAVFNDAEIMSLTRLQLPKLWHHRLDEHFMGFDQFQADAKAGSLPQYSFVEPNFVHLSSQPNDQHPPHNVALGDKFLHDVWKAVSTGKNWSQTLLIITYDEHGGCYDHVPPLFGAQTPDSKSNPGEQKFYFKRFGVRVPTIVVSPLIKPGTVFRAPAQNPYTPFDHTSILATLRDWLQLSVDKMPRSARTASAPTLAPLLELSTPCDGPPDIPAPDIGPMVAPDMDQPLSELQRSIVAAAEAKLRGQALSESALDGLLTQTITTRRQAAEYLLKTVPRGR